MRKTIIVLAILPLLFLACSTKKPAVKKVDNPANLYVESLELMKKKKYEQAIQNFTKIRENFPFDPIAVVAQVKQGDAYLEKKEYLMAAGIYEDFFNSYPEDENAPYVLRRLGETYEKVSPKIDRDQANTFKAIERFTYLKNRYPNSPHAKEVDVHLKRLEGKLAAREFYVGEFYWKTERYNASIIRLEYFLEKYPQAKDRDKALYYLSQDYRELNRPEKSQYYADRLKQEYPKSSMLRSAMRERKSLRVAKTEPVKAAAQPVLQTPSQQATPVSYSFEKTKKRELDLRPIEPPSIKQAGTTVAVAAAPAGNEKKVSDKLVQAGETAGKKDVTKDQAPATVQEKTAVSSDQPVKDKIVSSGAGAVQVAEGTEKPGAQSTDQDRKQAKKSGDKKDSLGFSEKKPVDVVADTMEGLEKGKIIVFKGNVIAKQVDLYLFSDILTAYMNEETNEIERAKAEGNVKIVKLDRTATCKEAFFYNDKGEIVLKGDVVVFSGKDRLSGDTVTYYINEDRVFVQGGEKDKRAKATVTPK